MRQTPKGTVLAKIVAIVGATASGKTELAIDVAQALGGEVVSADSRQVYCKLDAGTAKPRRDLSGLVEGVPYHLLDCADPSENFDAGRYARLAKAALEDIHRRGRFAIIAGGTGLYLRALLEGLSPMPPSDPVIRRRLQDEATERGNVWLSERLCQIDPVASAKIPANNIQRTLRALEVFELTGSPISSFWSDGKKATTEATLLTIEWPAQQLKERIAKRSEIMWPGILCETRQLLSEGYSGLEPGFQSLGYPQAVRCLRGELSEVEGLAALIQATCQYAKRQRTWFRHQMCSTVSIAGGERRNMLSQALEALAN